MMPTIKYKLVQEHMGQSKEEKKIKEKSNLR